MSHLSALFRVGFDLDVFRHAAAQRSRRSFTFLLLLVLISTLAGTVWFTLMLRDVARKIDPVLDQLPTVTIRDGKASCNVPQPWRRALDRTEDGKQIVVIIDTTGQTDDLAPDEYGVLLQREQLVFKNAEQRRELSLSQVPDMVIGPKSLRQTIQRLLVRAPFWIGGVLLVYFFFVKLIQALLLVLVALIGAQGRKPPLGFGQLLSVATYALAPAVLLDVAVTFLPLHVPFFWFVYVAVAAGYAVVGARRASIPPDGSSPADSAPPTQS